MKTILFFSFFFLGIKYDLPVKNSMLTDRIVQPAKKNLSFDDWSVNLSKFKDAVVRGDKVTVKSFFEFPIENPGNDIWFVADTRNVTKMSPNKIVPFQESDFDNYYGAILSKDFRMTLEKVDIKKLAKDTLTETPELIVVSPATSKMKATHSESANTITLSLISKSPEFGRFSIDYHFKILPDGNIKFSYVKFII